MAHKNKFINNEIISEILVEELSRYALFHYFVSPGSRSTPLTATIASRSDSQVFMNFDERSAAFKALGYAKATHKPAILVCTSGSAASNFYPAIVEADSDNIPLIILTADRPPELHGVRANQTMDQQNLYGKFVTSFLNIEPLTDNSSILPTLNKFSRLITKCLSESKPVHINCMFREPLISTDNNKIHIDNISEVTDWFNSSKPAKTESIKESLSNDFVSKVLNNINTNTRTIVIAGSGLTLEYQKRISQFSETNNLPIFADIRSGLRLNKQMKNVISYFDQVLLSDFYPDEEFQFIHFGGNIVSKRFVQFIEESDVKEYIVIDNSSIPYNAHHKMTEFLQSDVSTAIDTLDTIVKPFDKKFLTDLQSKNHYVDSCLIANNNECLEVSIVREISESIKPNSALFIANSMPIRDFDMYAPTSDSNILVESNRGVSGIDGTIATGVGFSLGSGRRATIVLGDLALLHDLNSLSLIKDSAFPITVVVINNNGGGIFSFLPVRDNKDLFENYFGTPHGFSFIGAASMFKLSYSQTSNVTEFQKIYQRSQNKNEPELIEVISDRETNYQSHLSLQNKIQGLLEK